MILNEKFETNAFINIQEVRLNGILKYLGEDFFKNKSLHEIGCGYAFYGNYFSKLCSDVIVSDARIEHINEVKKRYPYLNPQVLNINGEFQINNVDILIHFGVLYHIQYLEEHFSSLRNKCKYIILESIILDSYEEELIYINEFGPQYNDLYDQAFDKIGNRPSQKLIESLLTKNDYKYVCIDNDESLNFPGCTYTWKNLNTKKNCQGGDSPRRFWICWAKTENCPIKNEFIKV